jgi:hypothetical protein
VVGAPDHGRELAELVGESKQDLGKQKTLGFKNCEKDNSSLTKFRTSSSS